LSVNLSDDEASSDALVIGLAVALGTVVLIVVIGLIAFALRRRRAAATPSTPSTSATSATTPTSTSTRDIYQSFSSQRQEYDTGDIESIQSHALS
jgi:hypothetical protein